MTARPPLWRDPPPGFTEVVGEDRAVFARPELHGRGGLALRRALRHPLWTVGAARRQRSLRSTLGLLLWQETASWFGYDVVELVNGDTIRLRPLVRNRPLTGSTEGPADITGLVIAQDEAALIGRVLRSLAPYVAKTVVVDGGSTDDTAAIARDLGATVVPRPFDNDFAAQRNAGLEHVTTPWVLTLDCDEQLPPELGDELLRCVAAPVDAVFVSRLDLVGDDPQPSLFPDMLPRLFRSHLRYRGWVHERIDPRTAVYLPANGPFIHHHKSPLRHYTNSLRYSEINPGQSTPELVAWMQQEVERLRRDGPGDGDLPRSNE